MKIYKLIAKHGKDWCYLITGEVQGQAGLFIAAVVYRKETIEETVLSLKTFTSTENLDKAVNQAKSWIKSTLFSSYHENILSP